MSAPISFGFSKKVQASKLVDSKLRDESTKEREEEKDFVKLVVGNEIQGTLKKEVAQEWVIPLIKQNKWRVKDGNKTEDKNSESTTSKDSTDKNVKVNDTTTNAEEVLSPEEALKQQAVKELLSEANDANKSDDEPDYEIPLLLQNRIPNGYEEDDNMDVSLRPEQSTVDDYQQFPVEKFGMAMLLGMGWKKQEGIGRTNKGHIEMKEPTLRPKGLGLGAEKLQANKDAVPSSTKNLGDTKLTLKIGAGALITKGSNKGLYGQVESFDEDNNRVILRLALTGKMADVSKFYIDLVSPSDYRQKSKILNIEKYERYKNAEVEGNNNYEEDDRREHRNGNGKIEKDSRQHHNSNRNYSDDDDDVDDTKKNDHRTEYRNGKVSPPPLPPPSSSSSSSRRQHHHRRENYESRNERDKDDRNDRDSRHYKRRGDEDDDDDCHENNDESRSSSRSRSHRKKSKKEKKSKSKRRERDNSNDSSVSSSSSSPSQSKDRDHHHHHQKKKKSHKRKHRD